MRARDQHVVVDPLHLAWTARAARGGDRLDALALDGGRARSRPPASSGATNRRTSSISPASRNAPARCGPPSSSSDWTPRAPSSSSARAHARGLVLARGHDDLDAGGLEGVGRRCGTPRASSTTVTGTSRGAAHELRSSGQARLGVEHHAAGLARDALDARREQRVVRERRADPHRHGVRPPPASGATHARLASPEIHCESPLRVATLPSSVIADLNSTSGRPVLGVLAEGLVDQAGRVRPPRRRPRPPARPRRAGCPRPRPEACSVGSSEATTTRAMPASTIASVHGGVRPTWQQGSSETYSVAPAGSSVAGGERLALGVRLARRRGESPRRSPGRPSRAARPRADSGSSCRAPARRARSLGTDGARRWRWRSSVIGFQVDFVVNGNWGA